MTERALISIGSRFAIISETTKTQTTMNVYQPKSAYRLNPRAFTTLIEDVVQNGFQRAFGDEVWGNGLTIPVNIAETDAAYELHVVAPGLKKEDFRLNVDRNLLHVSYEMKEQEANNTEGGDHANASKWLRKEYKLGTFRRSFTLNEKINVSEISARYSDGILVVTLPKKEVQEALKQEIVIS
jgi:HSP20 family protein